MTKAAWERDAERFGRRFKFGEWESALLVARSVEKGAVGNKLDRMALAGGARASTSEFAAERDQLDRVRSREHRQAAPSGHLVAGV